MQLPRFLFPEFLPPPPSSKNLRADLGRSVTPGIVFGRSSSRVDHDVLLLVSGDIVTKLRPPLLLLDFSTPPLAFGLSLEYRFREQFFTVAQLALPTAPFGLLRQSDPGSLLRPAGRPKPFGNRQPKLFDSLPVRLEFQRSPETQGTPASGFK